MRQQESTSAVGASSGVEQPDASARAHRTASTTGRSVLAVLISLVALVVLVSCAEVRPRAGGASGPPSSTPETSSGPALAEDDQEWPAPARGEHDLDHPFVGTWVTEGGRVRQELLPDGRYEEARGSVEKAYTGRYRVVGREIYYVDDTGFTADGQFRDDVLHHGGMVMRRQ